MSSKQTLDNLLSVLGQIIVIVVLGIFTRKFEWLPKDTSSLSIVVGRFALPAIFFSFAAGMNLSSYNWAPLLSIIITKGIMIIVCGFIAWIARLKPFLSSWGIMGLFVTQSNDFALGIPVINALWDNDITHFADYAVINATLGLFTSSICIAFMLIGENSKSKSIQQIQNIAIDSLTDHQEDVQYQRLRDSRDSIQDHESEEKHNGFSEVFIALLRNPLLLALFLGLCVNGVCSAIGNNGLPLFFQELLHTISSPFNFLALLLMGIGMSGKVTMDTFFGRKALFPFMLVFLKMVVFPVIARTILNSLLPISGLKKETFNDFENFTFLYGQIPPAVTVVILAQSFNIMADQMLNGMMMALILCAPYIFVTSLIFGIDIDNVENLANEVNSLSSIMSSLSIIGGLLCLSAFILHKPWRRFPMSFVAGLVFCQSMLAFCKLQCSWKQDTDNKRWIYICNVFFRYTSHASIIVLSLSNALYRTKPSLIWNHIHLWKIMAPIMVLVIGCVGISFPLLSSEVEPVWVETYHTFCWVLYQPQFNFTISALAVYILIISLTLSISVYYSRGVISAKEVNKLNESSSLHKFIVKRNSSSQQLAIELLEKANRKDSFSTNSKKDIISVSAADFNAFYEEQFGIDLCFRLQLIVFCDLIRLSLRFVYMVYIITDSGVNDQSYYLVHLILAFINDSQGLITFLAFCISEPFWTYTKTIIHIITCGVFRKSNAISDIIAPSKYNIN